MKERKKTKKRGEREPRTRVGSLKYFYKRLGFVASSFVVGVCVCVCLCVSMCVCMCQHQKCIFLLLVVTSFLLLIKKAWKAYFNPNPKPLGHLLFLLKAYQSRLWNLFDQPKPAPSIPTATTLAAVSIISAPADCPASSLVTPIHSPHCRQDLSNLWQLVSCDWRVNWGFLQEGRGIRKAGRGVLS